MSKLRLEVLFKRKNYTTLILTPFKNIISFIRKFSPNLNLKNMISTYTKKKIIKKNGPNSLVFKERTFQIIKKIYDKLQQIAKNIKGFYFFYFHICYIAKFGLIIFWMIATLTRSQNPSKKSCQETLLYGINPIISFTS